MVENFQLIILKTSNYQLSANYSQLTLNYFNYFSEIEETFIRRRGKNLFLSPLDWALIETWQEREVPLYIVLRGIEKVFDNYEKSKKKRTIKGLAFCSEEIEAQYEEWLESQVGKNGSVETEEIADTETFSNEAIKDHLDHVSSELTTLKPEINQGLVGILERVISRLDELKSSFTNAQSLEEDLNHLEKLLDESLLENYEKNLLINLKNETAKELHNYQKTMEKEVYQKTFDLLLLKKLRLELGIPRLSLFYL